MITAFEVGSVFKIVDQSSAAIRTILRSAIQLDKTTKSIEKNLTAIGSAKLGTVATDIKAITAESVGMNKELGSSARLMGRLTDRSKGLSATASSIATVTMATQALALQWQNVAAQATAAMGAMKTAGRARLPPPLPMGSLPPPLPGAGRGGRHGPRQGWHWGRMGASVPVLGGHVHASTPSTGAGVATGAGMWAVYEIAKAAKEPMHQEAMLKVLGLDQATIGSMSREARDIAISVPGSGYAKNMQNMGELYSIVGAEGAMAIAPKLAEIDRVQSIVGGHGKDQGSAYVLTRATELMGKLTDPTTHKVDLKLFGAIIDNMSKMSIASHGKVTPEEWLNYAKQAGPAAGNLDIEGLYTTSAIIQAMGGHRAGTAAQAIQRQFAGGKMTKPVAEELEHFGLLKSDEWSSDHGRVSLTRGAMAGFVGKLQKDPLTAIVEDFIPALESHGITSNEDMSRELYKLIGTGPAQREIYEIIRGREQIRQERERAHAALAPGAAISSLGSNDPEAVTSAFTTSFKDLLGAMGGPLMTAAIPGMRALTEIFNNLAKFASDHPALTQVLTTTGAGVAGGAGVGLASSWFSGPFGPAAGAIAGGGVGLGYGIWNQLSPGAKSGVNTGFGIGNGIVPGIGGIIGGGIGGAWGGIFGPASAPTSGGGVMPPQSQLTIEPTTAPIYLDGQKVAEVVTKYIARQGTGAIEGAPYHDSTHSFSPPDLALAF